MSRFYVILSVDRPDPMDPHSLFRTPDRGGPPMELLNPVTGEWDEEVSLIDYFTGDDMGIQEVPAEAAPDIADVLLERGDGE